ncbi:MAG: hypothetical protein ACK5MA_11350 [Parachlamydiaceae bacterium]
MKKSAILIPLMGLALASCGTVDKMNRLVQESTCSIYANSDAIQRSTEAVNRNAALVEASNQAIEENRKVLQSAGH